MNSELEEKQVNKRILLLLLPFWTPLIPSLGISCIKSYLAESGHYIKTIDANTVSELWDVYHKYFNVLKNSIPEKSRGNFFNIGHNVLHNHLMAYINKKEEARFNELISLIIKKNYFCDVNMKSINELNDIVSIFYKRLEKYLIELLSKEKPDVVGISVYTGTLGPSIFAFDVIKKWSPHILTVMGGGVFADHLNINTPNFKLFLEKTPFIDKIIVGEGEILFSKVVEESCKFQQKVLLLDDIDKRVVDISKTGIPDFSDFEVNNYPQLSHYASRSCPFQCSFCSETVQWGKYRKKNANQVVKELVEMYDKYKCQIFLLSDSLLNPIATSLSQEFIKENVSIYWDGYLRVDKAGCSIENTFLWRQGGFYRARLGVESGSNRILGLMDKRITTEDIKLSITNLAFAGIKTTTYWVIGYPGETENDFQQTLDLITELKDDIYEAECNPFNYFFTGQVSSDEWHRTNKSSLLYGEGAEDMLIAQTWVLDAEPSREEIHRRICRFVEQCSMLGIPNPYSMQDIYKADERWKGLHKNAVPIITEFKNTYITENKNFNSRHFAKVVDDSEDFNW